MFSRSQWFILAVFSIDILHIFSNLAPAPAGFDFINLAKSGSGRIWKTEIRYIPTINTNDVFVERQSVRQASSKEPDGTCKLYKHYCNISGLHAVALWQTRTCATNNCSRLLIHAYTMTTSDANYKSSIIINYCQQNQHICLSRFW